MEYRELGLTGKKLSVLSLGCGRLPTDDEEAGALVSRAIDLGINYLEGCWAYCDQRCEQKIRIGVKGKRDKVYISTKSEIKPETTADDLKQCFEESLKRLDVDYVDFYQTWGYNASAWDAMMKPGGALDVLEDYRSQGLIHHIGMTSHETNENVLTGLKTGRFESATIIYNMLDRSKEPVIEYAAENGIGIVVMVPLAGGLLATPSHILSELTPGQQSSTVETSLRFLLSNLHITTIPSGMTNIPELEENFRICDSYRPFTPEEMTASIKSLEEYNALGKQFCTGCRYCMPCPSGVDIPGLFQIRNYNKVFGLVDWAERAYKALDAATLPSNCTECGQCEEKCPNNIQIIDQLKEVSSIFDEVRTE
ncbi:MAG: aldo/keto reductase [Armatimonadota bacterium]